MSASMRSGPQSPASTIAVSSVSEVPKEAIPDFEGVLSGVRNAIDALSASRIRPVLNATGIIIHTNFGRAPLASAAIIAAISVGAQYNNLEYDLGGGARGGPQ